MSKTDEIKERVGKLSELANRMRGQLESLKGPEGARLKERAASDGKKMGIGAGIAYSGFKVLSVAALYIIAVIIFAVDVGLHRLWLSSLIVVAAFLILGGVIIAIGAMLAQSAAKDLPKVINEATAPMKQTGEQVKAEVDGIQALLKKEAEARQEKLKQLVEKLKANASAVGPAAGGAYVGYRLLKRAVRTHRQKKAILKVLRIIEEERASEAPAVRYEISGAEED